MPGGSPDAATSDRALGPRDVSPGSGDRGLGPRARELGRRERGLGPGERELGSGERGLGSRERDLGPGDGALRRELPELCALDEALCAPDEALCALVRMQGWASASRRALSFDLSRERRARFVSGASVAAASGPGSGLDAALRRVAERCRRRVSSHLGPRRGRRSVTRSAPSPAVESLAAGGRRARGHRRLSRLRAFARGFTETPAAKSSDICSAVSACRLVHRLPGAPSIDRAVSRIRGNKSLK